MIKHVRWLAKEVEQWCAEGIITKDQGAAIKGRYPDVQLAHACSFALEPVSHEASFPLANDPCQDLPVANDHVITLSPDDKKTWEIDFAEPRWQVIDKDQTVETGSLPWHNRFRLVYRPPAREEATRLANKELIWHGYLPSRAFHGQGRVD